MTGDFLLIFIVGIGLIFSVQLRKRNDHTVRTLRSERIRLAGEVQRAQVKLARLRGELASTKRAGKKATAEAEQHGRLIAEAEQDVFVAEQAEPIRIHVLDRTQIKPDRLWVVTFQKDRPGTDNEFQRQARWADQRHFIISANAPQEAEDRVKLRFPGASSFRILTPKALPDMLRLTDGKQQGGD
jgi:hypothetical protein